MYEDKTPYGLNHLEYVRFNCATHEHNEMATLMQSGQEGILKHLYMRSNLDHASEPTLACCATLLAVYFVLAFTMFGVGLPAGAAHLLRVVAHLLPTTDCLLLSAHDRHRLPTTNLHPLALPRR